MSHIEETSPSIPLNRDVELNFDWKEFFIGLTESAANFLMKSWADGGVSSAVNLIRSLSSLSITPTLSSKCWTLIALSFAKSLDDLKNDAELDIDAFRSSMLSAMNQAKSRIDEGEYVISRQFLSVPSSSIIYVSLRNEMVSNRSFFRLNALSDDQLSYRLDSLFNGAVFYIWSTKPEYYQPFADALETPVSDALESELGWRNYRQTLRNAFESRPTFGQEDTGISLSQLYVPLRAFWRNDDDGRTTARTYPPSNSQAVMLNTSLVEFVDSQDSDDTIRLIGGGPGSGKSTSLKALSSELSLRDDVRPLFVPLQHIGIERELRDSINDYFSERVGSPFRQAPLSRKSLESGPPIIFIFDGLDELVAPNESASDVVNLFAARVNSLSTSLAIEGHNRSKFIVSGRMLAFQAAKRLLNVKSHGCIEAYGYGPAHDDSERSPNPLWAIDQRPEWWKNYARATNSMIEVPPALEADKLSSITHEPLLCYLLVLAGFATQNWEQAADNPNRIYAALMQDVYNRGWGEGSLRQKTATLSDFTLLMRTFGLAAWLGGDARIASEASFKSTLPVTRAQEAWDRFNEDNGADVTNLAVNFYLKAPEGNSRGFEFTHKSFGEYLAAIAILEIAIDLGGLIERRTDHAMREWLDATKSGTISFEILSFLRDEVRLRLTQGSGNVVESMINTKRGFERIADEIFRDGLPLTEGKNWRSLERFQLNGETAVWAIINSCSKALREIGRIEESSVEVTSLDGFGLSTLINRHGGIFAGGGVIGRCFSGLKLKNLYLFGSNFPLLDISFSDIKDHTLIHGANLNGCNLEKINCKALSISMCHVAESNLQGISSEMVSISHSSFENCKFNDLNTNVINLDMHTLSNSTKSLFDNFVDTFYVTETEESINIALEANKMASELCFSARSSNRIAKNFD